MNIVGAAGMALLFGMLLVDKGDSMPPLMLALLLLFFFLTVGAPTATVLALSNIGGPLVRRIALGLNVALIMVWAASMIHSVIHPSVQIIWNFGAAIFYVWPEADNIRTLLAYEKKIAG